MDKESANRIGSELAKIGDANVKAFRDNDRIILMIQNAPEELRRLADALERVNIREIQALVAFKEPPPPRGGDSERR